MLIKIPNSEYSLDFQHGISCSVYKNHEYNNDLSGQRIIYDMADLISKLLEENANLKKTINDLERENKNSYTSGYNRGYDDGMMHDTCEAYSSGYEDGYKAARSDK